MNNYNILIVEDEFINAQFVEKAVEKLGYNVIDSVETAEEAIAICREELIHVVLMDINLEGSIDGIACAKVINKAKTIPIVYMTAFSDTQTINEASDTNFYGYLIKPFDYHDIEAVLAIAIKHNYLKKTLEKEKKNSSASILLGEEYKYQPKTKTLTKEDNLIKLTKNESNIFYCLFSNINQHVSMDYLLQHVWEGKSVSLSTIRDTVFRLRKKVPDLDIKTQSGMGYILESKSRC